MRCLRPEQQLRSGQTKRDGVRGRVGLGASGLQSGAALREAKGRKHGEEEERGDIIKGKWGKKKKEGENKGKKKKKRKRKKKIGGGNAPPPARLGLPQTKGRGGAVRELLPSGRGLRGRAGGAENSHPVRRQSEPCCVQVGPRNFPGAVPAGGDATYAAAAPLSAGRCGVAERGSGAAQGQPSAGKLRAVPRLLFLLLPPPPPRRSDAMLPRAAGGDGAEP